MRLERIVSRGRIVDLRSLDLEGALQELLEVCVGKFPDLKPEALLRGLLARESTMTTYLGFGVALRHVRVRMGRRYVLAIGRSRVGIRHDGAMADERVHLIVMLIAGESARDYLQVLASIARQVKDKDLVDNLVNAPDLDALHERLVGGFGGLRAIDTEDVATATLRFASGAIGAIDATSTAFPGYPERIELAGDRGAAVLETERLSVRLMDGTSIETGSGGGGGGAAVTSPRVGLGSSAVLGQGVSSSAR